MGEGSGLPASIFANNGAALITTLNGLKERLMIVDFHPADDYTLILILVAASLRFGPAKSSMWQANGCLFKGSVWQKDTTMQCNRLLSDRQWMRQIRLHPDKLSNGMRRLQKHVASDGQVIHVRCCTPAMLS